MRVVVLDSLPVDGKIIDWKLDLEGRWYVTWKRAIQFFSDEVGMFDHLTQKPLTNGTKVKWIVDDQRLLRLVCNILITKVEDNTVHC